MAVEFRVSGTCSVSVQFGKEISLEVNNRVRTLFHDLETNVLEGVTETVPTYAALMVHYDPQIVQYEELVSRLKKRIQTMGGIRLPDSEVVEIPVLYGGELGMDLEECAAIEGVSAETFINIHSQSD